MNVSPEKIAIALEKCSILELAIEVIESGEAKIIDSLLLIEPIPLQLLLNEGSRRLGEAFNSADEFLEKLLEPNNIMDAGTQAVLRHAILVKAIEKKYIHGHD